MQHPMLDFQCAAYGLRPTSPPVILQVQLDVRLGKVDANLVTPLHAEPNTAAHGMVGSVLDLSHCLHHLLARLLGEGPPRADQQVN